MAESETVVGAADNAQNRRLAVVVALLALLAGVAGWIRLAAGKNDPDIYWHLATGRWIAENGAIPREDVFSWIGIERGLHWISQEWLFGLGAWRLYEVGSWSALFAVMAVLIAVIVVLVYALTLQRSSWPILSVVAAVLAIVGLLVHMTPRPQLVTYALVLGVMLLLERDHPWPALLLVVLGVNVHGGVWPLYVAVFAYYMLPSRPWFVIAALATPLLTPHPLGLYPYPFPSLMPNSLSFISEFAPTAPASRPQYLAVLILLLLGIWGERVKVRDALLGGAIVLLSLAALRHMVFVYILLVPIMSPYVASRLGQGADARSAKPPAARSSRIDVAIMVVLTAAIAILVTGSAVGSHVDADRGYPAAALAWLENRDAKRIFNLLDDGGYIIFNGAEPFIDGRGDPFFARTGGGAEIMGPYVRVIHLKADPLAYFKRFRMDYAVLPDSMPITRALKMSSEAEAVYAKDGYTVFALNGNN